METAASNRGRTCDGCRHVRRGGPVTDLTFDAFLGAMKPKVATVHARRMEEERQAASELAAELVGRRERNQDEWSRRPTAPMQYCGVDELTGRYHVCEVKNLDERCRQFRPRAPDDVHRACRTCTFNTVPLARVLLTLQETIGRGERARDLNMLHVEPALEAQAGVEYAECVDGAGSMRMRPGMLPVCEAYSTASDDRGEPRYVVGPVVNAAASCPSWEAGTSARNAEVVARLESLLAEARRTRESSDHLPPIYPGQDAMAILNGVNSAAGNDEADIIEFCLAVLGQDPDFVELIGSTFMNAQWFLPRSRDGGAGPAATEPVTPSSTAPVAPAAAVQPSPPFAVQPLVVYQHPAYPRISFHMATGPQVLLTVMVGDASVQFDLAAFPQGSWTQLRTPEGPLPITVAPQLPAAVHAAWY